EEGDDFGVDVLLFHTCLVDILGFLEKLEWWFEQDIDDKGEEDKEGEGGSEIYSFGEIGDQVMTLETILDDEEMFWDGDEELE
ncbi:hypothetical protein Tco_0994064, partial [Tanacetum coccineum]